MRDYTEKIDYKNNIREYYSFLKKHKFIVIFLLFIVLIHEIKQILDRYLFKIIIDNGTEFFAGRILVEELSKTLTIVALIFISAIIINFFMSWIKIYYLNRLDGETMLELKQKYFNHILGLDYEFHTTHKTGSLISRLNRGNHAMERMNDTLIFEFAPLVLQTIVVFIALLYLDKTSAFIILGVMITFISFNVYRQRISEESNILANKTEDFEKGNLADFFTNVDSVRNFGKESLVKSRYAELSKKTKEKLLINWDYYNFTSAGQSLILGMGTFLLMSFSISNFMQGTLSLGTLAFIYTTYIGLIGPLFSFVHGIRNVSRGMADFQELFEYGKIEKKIKDRPNAKKYALTMGEVEFKDISFSYGEMEIFNKFNLKIPANKKVALVGHSGSGKTTLVKLLYRNYDVDFGQILVDGKDIKDFNQEFLRSEMSIVPQECVLFDDTIFNNIKFSKPSASREEIIRAIKFAQLDKIIEKFPNKENTIVGERGIKLSGGEKQRVSIARAILANKKILVLDEATSSLDSETEFEIKKSLEKLMKGRTSIIIAHRLSTIMNADIIVVMKNGKIIQKGNHRELITEGGEYQRLWDLQKGGYIN